MNNSFLENLGNKKGIVSIILAVVCIGILFFAYRSRVEKAVNSISVPYALEELSSREEITAEKVGSVKIAYDMKTDNLLLSVGDVVGKYVNYNTTIPKGSLFYSSSITDWTSMPDSAWSNIEDGYTVVSLSVNGMIMFKNAIYPNAVIDLYYQTYYEDKLVYGKLIENIKVLAVKDENGKHIFEKTASQSSASAIIFSVPEDLNLLLRKASYLTGSIVPVLRNSNYTNSDTNQNKTLVSSEYIKELILDQTIDVPQDVIDSTTESITINGEEVTDLNSNTQTNTEEKKDTTNNTNNTTENKTETKVESTDDSTTNTTDNTNTTESVNNTTN